MYAHRIPPTVTNGEEADATAAPGWFVTYADLMSLLLTFFILLTSMSEFRNEPRVAQAVDSMQRQFGDSPHRGEAGAGPAASLFRPNLPPRLRTSMDDRNSIVGGEVVFAVDSAELGEPERRRLQAIVEAFRGKTQRIEIRGHSVRRSPTVGSPHADHWDLAYARCRAVMAIAVEAGVEPRRLRLSVAGFNEPTYVGDEARETRENSRVELFLLPDFADGNEKAGTTAAKPQTTR